MLLVYIVYLISCPAASQLPFCSSSTLSFRRQESGETFNSSSMMLCGLFFIVVVVEKDSCGSSNCRGGCQDVVVVVVVACGHARVVPGESERSELMFLKKVMGHIWSYTLLLPIQRNRKGLF